MDYRKVVLKKGKEKSVLRRHPWIFSGAIATKVSKFPDGEIVEVFDTEENYLCSGHYTNSSIAVRVLTFVQQPIDRAFFTQKVRDAVKLRDDLFNNRECNVFRVIHGEGDGLPGFVADFYNGHLVFQFHAIGMYQYRELFTEIFLEVMGSKVISIYDKSSSTLSHYKDVTAEDTILWGKVDKVVVNELGNLFEIDIVEGQKTGFFIDQRENRKLLHDMCKDKRVLNTFCYTGGFSVAALHGEAKEVVSVDCSQLATSLTDKNVLLNMPNCTTHTSVTVDAFEYLKNMDSSFDIIVLDPPAFAKGVKSLSNALKGYRKINRWALRAIKPGGYLFTFSCSQVVSKDDFKTAVFSASVDVGREVKIINYLSQGQDHPISVYHPEGDYLKGLVVQVI